MNSKLEDVATQLRGQRRKKWAIIESVIFRGEQELSLRGDKDSGSLSLGKPLHKDGKFRALLLFRASYEESLGKYVIKSSKNAKSQNEIIKVCGKLTQQPKSKYFVILGDETFDVSGIQQFSLCVRKVTLKLYVQ